MCLWIKQKHFIKKYTSNYGRFATKKRQINDDTLNHERKLDLSDGDPTNAYEVAMTEQKANKIGNQKVDDITRAVQMND